MAMLEVRLGLLEQGYWPLPVDGKACRMAGWQDRTDTSAQQIKLWPLRWGSNTGALTRWMPTLDLDLLNPEAAYIAEDIVRRRYEADGQVLVRIGQWPKRAIPFQTNEPFRKIKTDLIAPDGSVEKVEFLGDGQQVVVHGVHPGTGLPYRWCGGELWRVPSSELPRISEPEALVNLIVGMLCGECGYKVSRQATTHHASLMTSGMTAGWKPSADYEVPKALYFLARRVTRCPRDKRRVIGVLRPLARMGEGEGRNRALFNKAVCFREEFIRSGIITWAGAESLLLEAARLNGYIRKDGIDEAIATVRSGLGPKDINEAWVCGDG
jgi:hypothetical protein